MAARVSHASDPDDSPHGWSRDYIADLIYRRRRQLIRQVPGQLRFTRALNEDQHAWIVDEAAYHLVTQNEAGEIVDRDSFERAFWKVAHLRALQLLEGRYDTVRAGWERVDLSELALCADDSSPEEDAIRSFERGVLEEFAAELSRDEQMVLAVKYSGPKELGRFEIAKILGLKPHEARRYERSIARKLKSFSAIVAAGSLCDERHPQVQALAVGIASSLEARVAKVHLRRCLACRAEYKAYLRAIHTGRLPREVAQILPAPTVDAVERHRGPWEVAVDWLSKPFGHDAALTAAHVAQAGRGLSSIAGAKLLGMCLTGVFATGGVVCVHRLTHDPPAKPTVASKPKPAKPSEPDRYPPKTIRTGSPITQQQAPPTTKPKKSRAERGEVSSDATSHEKAAAISPPATAPGGETMSEFEPGPARSAPSQPAAAPANGGPEFP